MKKWSLLLTAILILGFAAPSHAAFIMKREAVAKQAPAANEDAGAGQNEVLSKEAIAGAVDEFKNLPRAERAERIHEAREELRNFKSLHPAPGDGEINTLLLVIIAILLPPLAVGLHDHGLTSRFWISLLLWLLFYIPGLIYALYVILKKD